MNSESGASAAAQRDGDLRDQLLDHEYDGIHEYDNPPPGWWHMIFLGSVLFALPYAFLYHCSPMGLGYADKYEAQMTSYYQEKFAKFGELAPDEATIAGLMLNETYMAATAATFRGKCAPCHGRSGEGLVGANLTDDVYIHVKQLPDIFKTINEGVVAKGMPAWGRQLNPNQIILLSAYVASIRGENAPGGKEPQGEQAPPWPSYPMLDFDKPDDAAAAGG